MILDQLGDHELAVQRLIRPEVQTTVDQIVEYVKKHSLFNSIVKLPAVPAGIKRAVCRAWAEKMESEDHKLQAAILFRQGGTVEGQTANRAGELFFARNRWKLAAASQIDSQKSLQTQWDPATLSPSEAGMFSWEIKRDPEEAVAQLVQGAKWEEALMVTSLAKRADLEQTEIVPSVNIQVESFLRMLNVAIEEWKVRLDRILELRSEQKAKIQLIRDGIEDDQVSIFEMVSS